MTSFVKRHITKLNLIVERPDDMNLAILKLLKHNKKGLKPCEIATMLNKTVRMVRYRLAFLDEKKLVIINGATDKLTDPTRKVFLR